VVIGYASGEWPKIDVVETLMKNISLVGAMPVGYSPEFMQEAHRDLMSHWQQGQLKVSGCQVFDFDDGLKAIEHIAAGKVEGKVVVRVS
jgi:NADPH2:quinone reductase